MDTPRPSMILISGTNLCKGLKRVRAGEKRILSNYYLAPTSTSDAANDLAEAIKASAKVPTSVLPIPETALSFATIHTKDLITLRSSYDVVEANSLTKMRKLLVSNKSVAQTNQVGLGG